MINGILLNEKLKFERIKPLLHQPKKEKKTTASINEWIIAYRGVYVMFTHAKYEPPIGETFLIRTLNMCPCQNFKFEFS